MFISKNGITIRTPANGISVIGRATQGMRLMKLSEQDKVVAAARIVRTEPEENNNDNKTNKSDKDNKEKTEQIEDKSEPQKEIEDKEQPEKQLEDKTAQELIEEGDTQKI